MAFQITETKWQWTYPADSTAKRKDYIEAACLSSDTKPTEDNYATGSICVEVDTGNVFFYNATGKTWVEQFSFKG